MTAPEIIIPARGALYMFAALVFVFAGLTAGAWYMFVRLRALPVAERHERLRENRVLRWFAILGPMVAPLLLLACVAGVFAELGDFRRLRPGADALELCSWRSCERVAFSRVVDLRIEAQQHEGGIRAVIGPASPPDSFYRVVVKLADGGDRRSLKTPLPSDRLRSAVGALLGHVRSANASAH